MTSPATTPTGPNVGDMAPDFTLSSTSGEKVKLSDVIGDQIVLLAFFPLAFTSVCTTEMAGFHEDMGDFETNKTRVLGISVDSVPTLKEFQSKLGIRTEMLSDFKREVSRLYGVLNEDTFFSQRAYFLIDRSGVIGWRHVEGNIADRRENREILDAIETIEG